MIKKSLYGLGILVMLVTSSGSSSFASETNPAVTITLERSVHFFSAEGSDVVVNPGTYLLEPAEEWLRLVPGERRDALLLEAERAKHEEDISEPLGLSVPSEGDEHVIALLLPGGTSLEAIGSYSGIRSRALSTAQLLQRRARLRQAAGARPGTTNRKPAPTGTGERPAYYDGPRIRSVQLPSGTVMGQNILLHLNLDQLVPNVRVDYVEEVLMPKDSTGSYPPCFFRIEPGLGRAAKQATAAGELTLAVSGWFHWRSYNGAGEMPLNRGFKSPDHRYPDPPKCGLRIKLKTWSDSRYPSYKEVTYSNLQMSLYTTYSVKNTWALKDKFDFKLADSMNSGICRGTSLGIPNNYSVGVQKYGNDISMRIRSGPIGTNCLFTSQKWWLPNGMFVSSIDSDYIYEGKPKAENACRKNYTGFDFNRGADIPLVHTSYEAIPHDLRTTFTRWGINLKCGLSITNDHGVRFRINEIVFKGPAGLNFP